MMNIERTKMTAGKPYQQFDPELIARRELVRQVLHDSNQLADNDQRNNQIKALLADVGEHFFVEAGMEFDYGFNIHIGDHFYGNYHLTMLDTCPITIGTHCYVGPDVGFYTPVHPLAARERDADVEMGAPITLGDSIWIGGHATILPGVTLGDNVVVGAGSVVTKSFPSNVVIAGNPARIIRRLDANGDVVADS
ncbi:sugar O-acetyltransferase [Lacticaseibacillus thailandensis]|uniref:Galactoside O-acetyltransferase n=1 Tax=Lacticaseibacillus thailandensis DSM 22698 = JCM 13996 TaxID=1423810 RepID=A0A0R2CAM8_9LACO|nr:sugar O-acetyltransferase [Lacticaseibacillus thailandensis]KRM88162.1 galactoside O-acetyltransferase [Lacticaseibacillus thailandensis DSM 22698 = JCM 13996]